MVLGRTKISPTVLSPLGASGRYSSGFKSLSWWSCDERRGRSNPSTCNALHYSRELPHVDVLFEMTQDSRGLPIEELLLVSVSSRFAFVKI